MLLSFSRLGQHGAASWSSSWGEPLKTSVRHVPPLPRPPKVAQPSPWCLPSLLPPLTPVCSDLLASGLVSPAWSTLPPSVLPKCHLLHKAALTPSCLPIALTPVTCCTHVTVYLSSIFCAVSPHTGNCQLCPFCPHNQDRLRAWTLHVQALAVLVPMTHEERVMEDT